MLWSLITVFMSQWIWTQLFYELRRFTNKRKSDEILVSSERVKAFRAESRTSRLNPHMAPSTESNPGQTWKHYDRDRSLTLYRKRSLEKRPTESVQNEQDKAVESCFCQDSHHQHYSLLDLLIVIRSIKVPWYVVCCDIVPINKICQRKVKTIKRAIVW